MIASRERQHGDRVSKLPKYQTRILPIAALYGGNASGKTNFFKAISFARSLIVDGTKPSGLIPVEHHLLDAQDPENPSRFEFLLLIDEKIYEFVFSVNKELILEEKLSVISTSSERLLYRRRKGEIEFCSSLNRDPYMHFAFRGTRRNQLFLTNAVSQQIEFFRPIYDWFENKLVLIGPDSRFAAFEQFVGEEDLLHSKMSQMLSELDTGINHLGSEEISLDKAPFNKSLKNDLLDSVKEGQTVRLFAETSGERYIATRTGNKLIVKKPIVYHYNKKGTQVKFELRQESDGSQRLVDLLPAFVDLASRVSKKVYVIDEIDRSLHTLLMRKLLEEYLSGCTRDTRKQLLFTTHDILQMDQNLLRRDEMWVVERNTHGSSRLFSFSEYKDVRYDKDIRKSYLQGRLGGIPYFPFATTLADLNAADASQKNKDAATST